MKKSIVLFILIIFFIPCLENFVNEIQICEPFYYNFSTRVVRTSGISGDYGYGGEIVLPERKANEAIEEFFTFQEYMDSALYNPQFGFFGAGRVKTGFDLESEFITFPESLSPIFGQLILEQAFKMWQGMVSAGTIKEDEEFNIVEFGAGQGWLGYDILISAKRMSTRNKEWKKFYDVLVYKTYDVSESMLKGERKMKKYLNSVQGLGEKLIVNYGDARKPLDSLLPNSVKGLVVSNELLDNFPAQKIRLYGNGDIKVGLVIPRVKKNVLNMLEKQNMISENEVSFILDKDAKLKQEFDLKGENFIYLDKESYIKIKESLGKQDRKFNQHTQFLEAYVDVEYFPEILDYIKTNSKGFTKAIKKLDKNQTTEVYVNIEAERYLKQISNILNKGYILTIDMGGTSDKVLSSDFKPHKTLKYPYRLPGEGDLVSYQDFTALSNIGVINGIQTKFFGLQKNLQNGVSKLYDPKDLTRMKMHILVKTLLANEEVDKDKLMSEITPVLAQKGLKTLINYLSKIHSNLDIAVDSYLEEIPFFILEKIANFGAVSSTFMLLQQKEDTDENYTFQE